MKVDRFDYLVWAILASLGLAILGVYFVGTRRGIQVVSTYPENNASVGPFSRIGLSFPQPMVPETVEWRFEISPNIAGQFRWEGNTVWFVPTEPYQLQTLYTVRLSPGAIGTQRGEVKDEIIWQFRVRDPAVLYLASGDGAREVWRGSLDDSPPVQLTATGGKVFDFAVSKDGEKVAYSVLNDRRGIDLWLMNRDGSGAALFLDCGLDRCSTPAWSPDDLQIAYSREQAGLNPGEPLGPPRVWLLDTTTGETVRLFANSQKLGYKPSWAPRGEQLALFDSGERGIRIVDLSTGDELILPSVLGLVGSWSPTGDAMLFTNINSDGEQPQVQMYRADFASDDISLIRGVLSDETADYSSPVWSPDGEWVLVGIRNTDSSLGRQLYVIPPDARFAQQITAADEYTHYNYNWDPWGMAVAYQRIQLGAGEAISEVMVWHMETGEQTLIARDATNPIWSP